MNGRCTGCNNRISVTLKNGDKLSNYGCGNCCGCFERLTSDIGYVSYGIYFYKNSKNKYFITNESSTKWIPVDKPSDDVPTMDEIKHKYYSIR